MARPSRFTVPQRIEIALTKGTLTEVAERFGVPPYLVSTYRRLLRLGAYDTPGWYSRQREDRWATVPPDYVTINLQGRIRPRHESSSPPA